MYAPCPTLRLAPARFVWPTEGEPFALFMSCTAFRDSRIPCIREEVSKDAGAGEEDGTRPPPRISGCPRGGGMSDKRPKRAKARRSVVARSPDELGKVLGLSDGDIALMKYKAELSRIAVQAISACDLGVNEIV